ncbi:something about silencing 10 [Brachionus plicatilis]|uniref:Something about silencing 10 n=1 Tax=Brachionus plicatilis TaxID=10195 RepID=A0A3M7Q5H4_BRAPC|nr:something about silencing 10 [Brachionus plicatilis]
MVRSSKKQNRIKKEKYQSVNSDSDNDHYNGDFDPSNPLAGDEIEDFNSNQDKILFDKMDKKSKKSFNYSSDENEVLAFDDDDDSDDDKYDEDKFDIDDEDDEEDKELIDEDDELISSAWGSKKSIYYSGNRIENDEDAELEEEEARMLQSKMMKQLDTNDFGLDAFKKQDKSLKTTDELEAKKIAQKALGEESDDEMEKNFETISKNLEKMSTKEKLEFLRQESPEFLELVRDFKEKMSELHTTLLPIYRLIKNGRIPSSIAADFIMNKTKLYLMYASHLSLYFALKSQRLPIDNHPIVKNILQFRNLCKQIAPIDESLNDEVKFLIESIENGRQLNFRKSKQDSNGNRAKKSVKFSMVREDRNRLVYDDDVDSESGPEMAAEHTEIKDEHPNADKRAINYEIMKNKGLTPKRDKMYRNPRVRNRIKSRKALIKHKSIVPKVRTQDKRYGGEATGIRTNVVRAVKIK